MAYDFNNAESQRAGDLIPDGTIATVHMTLRPGNAGEGGWLKRSKAGDSEMLDCEFTVVDGQFAKRKFWTLMTVNGTTDGQKTAADISASRIRGMLESVHGIRPDDETPAASEKRRIGTWGDLDGIRFVAKIGVEKGKGDYKDKNVLVAVITPDRKDWVKVEQVKSPGIAPIAQAAQAVAANAGAAAKPSWAQ